MPSIKSKKRVRSKKLRSGSSVATPDLGQLLGDLVQGILFQAGRMQGPDSGTGVKVPPPPYNGPTGNVGAELKRLIQGALKAAK
jgi:hypothetical protein